MISLRYHLLSLTVAVLALVLGLVLGASALSGRLVEALTTDRTDLAARAEVLRGEAATATAGRDDAERFVAEHAAATVRGTLSGRSVAVVALGDADAADLGAVTDLVGRAGGRITGRLELTREATAPERAAELRALVPRLLPAGAQLPSTTEAAELTGALLGSVVAQRPGGLGLGTPAAQRDREVVAALAGLADAGFVRPVAPVAPQPAQLVVVVAGADRDPARGRAGAALASALDDRAGGAVLAGRDASATLAALPTVTTTGNGGSGATALAGVEGVERPSARVRAVLELGRQAGQRSAAPVSPATSPAATTGAGAGTSAAAVTDPPRTGGSAPGIR